MKTVIHVIVAALMLYGCATNGEIGLAHHPLECSMGIYHSDCNPGTFGYRESPQDTYNNAMKEAIKQAGAVLEECQAKRLNGELHTYVQSFECSHPRVVAAYQQAPYHYMDLLNLFEAKRHEVDERMDAKQLTETQMEIQIAELLKEWRDQERQRNIEVMQAQSLANQDASQRMGAAAAMLGAMRPVQAPAPVPQPYMPRINRPIQTNCNGIGNAINCTSY